VFEGASSTLHRPTLSVILTHKDQCYNDYQSL
jgi:hypothetical protein